MIKKWILGDFFKKNKGKYTLGIAALLCTSLMQISIPKLLGYIADIMESSQAEKKEVLLLTLGILGISIAVFFTKYIWRSCIIGNSRMLECELREKLFAHFQSLPVSFYNNRKTGDLMAYAINDLGAVKKAFAFGLVGLIDLILINFGSIIIMTRTINPILTAAAVGPIVISVFIMLKLRKQMRKKFTKVQEAFADVSDKVQENISGIRVVKGYVQEEQEIEKVKKASDNRKISQMNYIKTAALLQPVVLISFGVSFTITLIMGSKLVTSNVITLGDLVAFNTYLAMLNGPVMRIARIIEVWQQAFASIKRLDDIFHIKTDIK